MSRPRFRWWGYAINVTEDLLRFREAKQLTPNEYWEREALLKAIETTKRLPRGSERLSVIGFIYWTGKKHTIQEASDYVGTAEATAREWHSDFIRLVGECLGFDTSQPPKKRGRRPKRDSQPKQSLRKR